MKTKVRIRKIEEEKKLRSNKMETFQQNHRKRIANLKKEMLIKEQRAYAT